MKFTNNDKEKRVLNIFWVNSKGRKNWYTTINHGESHEGENWYATIKHGESHEQSTYVGHQWRIRDKRTRKLVFTTWGTEE